MLGSRGKSSSLFRIAGVDENLREPRIERLSWAESRLSLRVRVNGSYADKVELVPNNHVFDAAQ
jgi:hypothetical protein